MRVLIITNLYPRPDQPARGMFNAQMVREMARRHTVSVRVLVPQWRVWRWRAIRRWRMAENGVDTAYLPVFYLPGIGRNLSYLTYRLSLPRELSAAIRDHDAVLVPWLYPDGDAVVNAARCSGRPVWLMTLGSDTFHLASFWRRRAILHACKAAAGVICVCRLLADRLAAAGVPEHKLHVVPNGVNTTIFRHRVKESLAIDPCKKIIRNMDSAAEETPCAAHAARAPEACATVGRPRWVQIEDASHIVLFVGNLVPVKAPDVMVKAFAEMVKGPDGKRDMDAVSVSRSDHETPGIRRQPVLLIIGSGIMRPSLEALARDLGVGSRVCFLGTRPLAEVALWMNRADVLCLSSWGEGMPNVVVEALASGLPVVATDVGNCRELLAGEPMARLVPRGDVRQMADALAGLLATPADRASLAARHGKRSWADQAEDILTQMNPGARQAAPGFFTITNLFPWPDRPTRGLFNFELFKAMDAVARRVTQDAADPSRSRLRNICLVPEWRLWRWPAIRKWKMPEHQDIDDGTVYLPVFYLPVIGRSSSWRFYYRALKGFFLAGDRRGEDGAWDVFLGSWLYPDSVVVAKLAARCGVRAWMRVHGSDRYHLKNPVRRRLILKACRKAEGVICNCKAVADDLVKWGVPPGKLHIVPNGVDESVFRYRTREALLLEDKKEAWPSPLRTMLSDRGTTVAGSGPRMILFVGNLVPIKCPDVLLKAFARMNKRAAGLSQILVIIGIGPMQSWLEGLAQELGIAGQVHFLGARPHDEVALWMNRANVLCLTSRSEGMPNVVVEALVSGLPVMATDVGACRELLSNEPQSRLCVPGDVDGIARALEDLLAAEPDRQAMAARHGGRFSWTHQAETIMGLMTGRGEN